jgi:transcriptional regulator with XRE-family HTH domain
MNIPYTISELRRVGLTQTDIGEAIGLKQTTVSDMEAGKSGIKRPSYGVVNGLEQLAAKHAVCTEPPAHSAQVTPP